MERLKGLSAESYPCTIESNGRYGFMMGLSACYCGTVSQPKFTVYTKAPCVREIGLQL